MKIILNASDSFDLALENGKIFHIREDGRGRLAIQTEHYYKVSYRNGLDIEDLITTNQEILIQSNAPVVKQGVNYE